MQDIKTGHDPSLKPTRRTRQMFFGKILRSYFLSRVYLLVYSILWRRLSAIARPRGHRGAAVGQWAVTELVFLCPCSIITSVLKSEKTEKDGGIFK